MMLSKLAMGNVKKSFKDYTIYFLTLVFAVCIFYMFNSIESQQELMKVTSMEHDAMNFLSEVLSYMSVFVSVVLGFLIVYANNFLIKRRKKELGIYMTLGMEKRKISTILMMETFFIGLFALLIGLIAGVFSSQLMSIFTAKMFEVDMTDFKFIFSIKATIKSLLYFGIIFSVVMVFNVISVTRCKLINLLYAENKNEMLKTKNIKVSLILFLLSVVSLLVSYYLILTNGMININIYFTLSLIFGLIGTFLFFMSLSGFLIKFAQRNKEFYFKNLNMFVLKQINSKINTTYISMSVICIALLLSIGALSSGMSLQNILSKGLKEKTPYDNSFFNYKGVEKDIYKGINKIYPLGDKVKNYEQHNIYLSNEKYDTLLSPEYKDSKYNNMGNSKIHLISLTDYNEILNIQGKKPINLEKNEYALTCNNKEIKKYLGHIIDEKKQITISNKKLNLGINNLLDTVFENSIVYSNMGTVVVNEEVLKGLDIRKSTLNIKYKDLVDKEKFDKDIKEIFYKRHKEINMPFNYNVSKYQMYLESVSTKTLVTFIGIYLGFVFLVACVAILALQQLSQAADNKKRYDLLKKIGVEKSMVNKALFTQIIIYFLMPLGLAIIHSIVGLSAVNDIIKVFGKVDLWYSILITVGFFVVIYGGYFIATYIGCKNIILKSD
ncbi:MAG: ABC transporter permease [Firmicutes bacterium]|nr:ABC transporter permease [Bacillota bacterium]